MLGDDWEDFDIDSVELIETGPCALLREAWEEFAHHLCGDLIWAVEDDTYSGESFGKVFGGLSFACACGSCGTGSEMMCNGTGDGNPALICQGCDNQPGSGSNVLIAKVKISIDLFDNTDIILIQVVFKLLLPVEIMQGVDLIVHEVENNIPVVDLSCDQGDDDLVV